MSTIEGQKRMYELHHIPREVRRYQHKEGDRVRFRSALGKLNVVVMEAVWQQLGRENLLVVATGDPYQVKVRNESGDEDILPGVWLIPSGVTDLEDYPAE